MAILGFNESDKIKHDETEAVIFELLNKNQQENTARIKIAVWRAEGGLYTPQNRAFEMLISVSDHKIQTELNSIEVDFCQQVRNNYSAFSAFKTLSSLPYAMAGLERKNS